MAAYTKDSKANTYCGLAVVLIVSTLAFSGLVVALIHSKDADVVEQYEKDFNLEDELGVDTAVAQSHDDDNRDDDDPSDNLIVPFHDAVEERADAVDVDKFSDRDHDDSLSALHEDPFEMKAKRGKERLLPRLPVGPYGETPADEKQAIHTDAIYGRRSHPKNAQESKEIHNLIWNRKEVQDRLKLIKKQMNLEADISRAKIRQMDTSLSQKRTQKTGLRRRRAVRGTQSVTRLATSEPKQTSSQPSSGSSKVTSVRFNPAQLSSDAEMTATSLSAGSSTELPMNETVNGQPTGTKIKPPTNSLSTFTTAITSDRSTATSPPTPRTQSVTKPQMKAPNPVSSSSVKRTGHTHQFDGHHVFHDRQDEHTMNQDNLFNYEHHVKFGGKLVAPGILVEKKDHHDSVDDGHYDNSIGKFKEYGRVEMSDGHLFGDSVPKEVLENKRNLYQKGIGYVMGEDGVKHYVTLDGSPVPLGEHRALQQEISHQKATEDSEGDPISHLNVNFNGSDEPHKANTSMSIHSAGPLLTKTTASPPRIRGLEVGKQEHMYHYFPSHSKFVVHNYEHDDPETSVYGLDEDAMFLLPKASYERETTTAPAITSTQPFPVDTTLTTMQTQETTTEMQSYEALYETVNKLLDSVNPSKGNLYTDMLKTLRDIRYRIRLLDRLALLHRMLKSPGTSDDIIEMKRQLGDPLLGIPMVKLTEPAFSDSEGKNIVPYSNTPDATPSITSFLDQMKLGTSESVEPNTTEASKSDTVIDYGEALAENNTNAIVEPNSVASEINETTAQIKASSTEHKIISFLAGMSHESEAKPSEKRGSPYHGGLPVTISESQLGAYAHVNGDAALLREELKRMKHRPDSLLHMMSQADDNVADLFFHDHKQEHQHDSHENVADVQLERKRRDKRNIMDTTSRLSKFLRAESGRYRATTLHGTTTAPSQGRWAETVSIQSTQPQPSPSSTQQSTLFHASTKMVIKAQGKNLAANGTANPFLYHNFTATKSTRKWSVDDKNTSTLANDSLVSTKKTQGTPGYLKLTPKTAQAATHAAYSGSLHKYLKASTQHLTTGSIKAQPIPTLTKTLHNTANKTSAGYQRSSTQSPRTSSPIQPISRPPRPPKQMVHSVGPIFSMAARPPVTHTTHTGKLSERPGAPITADERSKTLSTVRQTTNEKADENSHDAPHGTELPSLQKTLLQNEYALLKLIANLSSTAEIKDFDQEPPKANETAEWPMVLWTATVPLKWVLAAGAIGLVLLVALITSLILRLIRNMDESFDTFKWWYRTRPGGPATNKDESRELLTCSTGDTPGKHMRYPFGSSHGGMLKDYLNTAFDDTDSQCSSQRMDQ